MEIRSERAEDGEAIWCVITAAFKGAEHSSKTEAAIVDALRADGAMTVSLIALEAGQVIGQLAFSPVTIDGEAHGCSEDGSGWGRFRFGRIARGEASTRRCSVKISTGCSASQPTDASFWTILSITGGQGSIATPVFASKAPPTSTSRSGASAATFRAGWSVIILDATPDGRIVLVWP